MEFIKFIARIENPFGAWEWDPKYRCVNVSAIKEYHSIGMKTMYTREGNHVILNGREVQTHWTAVRIGDPVLVEQVIGRGQNSGEHDREDKMFLVDLEVQCTIEELEKAIEELCGCETVIATTDPPVIRISGKSINQNAYELNYTHDGEKQRISPPDGTKNSLTLHEDQFKKEAIFKWYMDPAPDADLSEAWIKIGNITQKTLVLENTSRSIRHEIKSGEILTIRGEGMRYDLAVSFK